MVSTHMDLLTNSDFCCLRSCDSLVVIGLVTNVVLSMLTFVLRHWRAWGRVDEALRGAGWSFLELL